MLCSVAVVRRFSEGLALLHAAPDESSLHQASAGLLQRLFPRTVTIQRDAWLRSLAAAAESPSPELPMELRKLLLLELLWFHLVDCHARLRGEVVSLVGESLLPPVLRSLTARERQVVAVVRLGQTDAAIGRALAISPKTVSKHVEHILEKLGVETRTAAVAVAYASESPAAPSWPILGARAGLSPRECEVLHWLAEGKRDSEIARILDFSTATASRHTHNILRKLGVRSRSAVVAALVVRN